MGRAEGKRDGGVRQVQRQGWDENLFVILFIRAALRKNGIFFSASLCFKICARISQN